MMKWLSNNIYCNKVVCRCIIAIKDKMIALNQMKIIDELRSENDEY